MDKRAPHWAQKVASDGAIAPQTGQEGWNSAPQFEQNLAPAVISASHFGQRMPFFDPVTKTRKAYGAAFFRSCMALSIFTKGRITRPATKKKINDRMAGRKLPNIWFISPNSSGPAQEVPLSLIS